MSIIHIKGFKNMSRQIILKKFDRQQNMKLKGLLSRSTFSYETPDNITFENI